MPELPGPPSEYDDEQRRAWFEGAATVAGLLAQQDRVLAKQYADAVDGDDRGDRDDDATDDSDDACPECGGNLVESFGGDICTECGHEPD